MVEPEGLGWTIARMNCSGRREEVAMLIVRDLISVRREVAMLIVRDRISIRRPEGGHHIDC